MTYILAPIAFLWAFWSLYLLCIGLYRAHLSGRLSRIAAILGAPWLLLGALVDVIAQMTVATVVFAEWPREWLVTQRLQRYIRTEPNSWRGQRAMRLCMKLLDPFDPTGKHC
jgi:hypothetical protein